MKELKIKVKCYIVKKDEHDQTGEMYVDEKDFTRLMGYTEALEKSAILDGYEPSDPNLVDWGHESLEVYFTKVEFVEVDPQEIKNPKKLGLNQEWMMRNTPREDKRREVYYE